MESVKDYAIYMLDPGGKIVSWNEGARRIKGYDSEEVLGTHFSRFFTPDDQKRHHAEEELAIATREGRFEEEGWRVRKDGSHFWANITITRVSDDSGNLLGFSKVTRDLTERRSAEAARAEEKTRALVMEQVRENERMLDQIFAESPSFMVLLSVPDYRFLRTNDAHLRLIRKANIIGKRVQDVEPELEAQGIINLLDQVVQTGKPFIGKEVEVHYDPGNGEPAKTAYLDFVYQPIRKPSGEVYAIVAQGYEVSDRVLARKAIENERENFRNLFKQTPEMVCILRGPDHVFEFVNEAHIKVLGFDATGKAVREAQPESVEVHGILDEVYRTGITAQLHEIPVTVTDRLRYFNLTYSARRDNAGQINGVMILGIEVTAQKLVEEALKKSEESFKKLAESIPQMVWTIQNDDSISYHNPRWEEYTGRSMLASQTRGMRDELHPDDFEKVVSAWKDAQKTAEDFNLEYRLKGKDGTYRWFLGRAVPLRDGAGNIQQWFGTTTDIDSTKRALLAQSFLDRASTILSSSLDYETTLQSIADLAISEIADWCGVEIADEQGVLHSVAVAHRDPAMIEFAREFRRLYPTEMDSPTGAPKVLRTGEPALHPFIPDEAVAGAAKDARHLEMLRKLQLESVIIVPLPGRKANLGTLALINSRKDRRFGKEELALAMELARRAALAIENSKLFSAQKDAIRARDEFLSIASHELKTPLTSLKLQAQLRKRDFQRGKLSSFAPEKIPELIAEDERQVNRLVRLVEDMLDVSRINTGRISFNWEEFDLCEMARETIARIAPQFEAASVSLECDAGGRVAGRWDKFRLEQVLINLLTNSLKYGAGKPVKVTVRSGLDTASLSVRDEGLGIKKEDHGRIFAQFERAVASTSISGLGLGLYISKRIVEAHGGAIHVESAPGKGSTFTVVLPWRGPETIQGLPLQTVSVSSEAT